MESNEARADAHQHSPIDTDALAAWGADLVRRALDAYDEVATLASQLQRLERAAGVIARPRLPRSPAEEDTTNLRFADVCAEGGLADLSRILDGIADVAGEATGMDPNPLDDETRSTLAREYDQYNHRNPAPDKVRQLARHAVDHLVPLWWAMGSLAQLSEQYPDIPDTHEGDAQRDLLRERGGPLEAFSLLWAMHDDSWKSGKRSPDKEALARVIDLTQYRARRAERASEQHPA